MPEFGGALRRLWGLRARLRKEFLRGRVAGRLGRRLLREAQGFLTRIVLCVSRPRTGHVTIATLDSAEENASATAVLLSGADGVTSMSFVSPNPESARLALSAAARRLGRAPAINIEFLPLSYCRLLRAYSSAEQTYSTHVLLPGTDPSNRRAHVHLAHGSGPKPDSTFRGPTNVLASFVGVWTHAQLEEYRLPASTSIVPVQPRIEIMRRAVGDRSILRELGLDEQKKLVVWAPTYRSIRRLGDEVRVSGIPFSRSPRQSPLLSIQSIRDIVEEEGCQFLAKVHPFDADEFRDLGVPLLTDAELNAAGITRNELFGMADLMLTDYSSVFTERAALGLPFRLFCPDLEAFRESYRGFRTPFFMHLAPTMLITSPTSLRDALSEILSPSNDELPSLSVLDDKGAIRKALGLQDCVSIVDVSRSLRGTTQA